MSSDKLTIHEKPKLKSPCLLLGFSGWMNSGEVSTATITWLVTALGAKILASIDPEGFYIYNFPGTMEMTALFRPYTQIEDGLIELYQTPGNTFFYDEQNDLILFLGKEPNLNWDKFADAIFEVCKQFNVDEIYFVGSVAGIVPHTRDPKIFCSVSDKSLKTKLSKFGIQFSNYEGPASFITHLTMLCSKKGLAMSSLVAAVPAYVEGENPKSIEAVIRYLKNILGINVNLDDMRELSDEFERRLSGVIQDMPELSATIGKLEESYDKEIFDHEMGDLKNWLEKQGIRLD